MSGEFIVPVTWTGNTTAPLPSIVVMPASVQVYPSWPVLPEIAPCFPINPAPFAPNTPPVPFNPVVGKGDPDAVLHAPLRVTDDPVLTCFVCRQAGCTHEMLARNREGERIAMGVHLDCARTIGVAF